MVVLDAIVSLGGLLFPPILDLVRKKWVGRDDDTPEATLATLATTKPEVMPEYVTALAQLEEARTRSFNRDTMAGGIPAQWVVTLRAAIRPVGTMLALMTMIVACVLELQLEQEIRLTLEAIACSWFGTRISLGRGSFLPPAASR